jgi:hypothetical protein
MPSFSGLQFGVNQFSLSDTGQSANASDSQGDTVVAWSAAGHIRGRVFDRIGNGKSSEFDIAFAYIDDQGITHTMSEPAVAIDPDGQFVVTWTDTESTGSQHVLGQLFDASASPPASTSAPFTIAPSGHESRVGMDRNGNFVVSYTSGSDVHVSMRFWDGSLNQDFAVASPFFMGSSHASSIACAPDGGFALAYQTDYPDPGASSVTLRQFDSGGVEQHAQTWGTDDARNGSVSAPSVAVDDLGNPVLALQSHPFLDFTWRSDVSPGLRYGDLQSFTTVTENQSTEPDPAVAADPLNSNYVVAYLDGNDTAQVMEVTPSGTTTTPLFFAQDASTPAVSVNFEHRFLVTYTSPSGPTTNSDIDAQFGQLGGLPGSPVFLSLTDHKLTATGDNGNGTGNTITVSNAPGDPTDNTGQLVITVNGTAFTLQWADASGGIDLSGDSTPYTFNIENVSEDTQVTVNTGAGNDGINLSPVAHSLDSFNGGLIVNGQGGTDSLQINDASGAPSTGRNYTLQDGSFSVGDLPSLRMLYSNIANVQLTGATNQSQGDTFTLKGPIANSSAAVTGGGMSDQFTVDFTAGNPIPIQGLSIDGGGNSNSVVLVGNQFPYETVTAAGAASGSIALQGYSSLFNPTYTLTYSHVQSITDVGVSPGRFSLATYLTVNTGALADAVGVVDGPVDGGFQTTRITGKNTPLNATFATLDFANRTYATVSTVANSARLTLNNPHPEVGLFSLTANGGPGNNTLIGPDQPTTWIVNAYNSGKVGSTVRFHNFQNLVGGAGNDIFQFTPTGNLAGTIDGGGGTMNRLDYSGNGGTPVTVNLQTAAAPRVKGGNPGGFSHIQFLRGGPSPNNILTGPNTTNLWVITGPNIGQVNGFAFVGMQNLVGGSGIDTFRFTPAGSVASIRAGGNLGDWLDYSPFVVNQPVNVNLATGSATGVGGGAAGVVHGIQNVRGGAGIDNLTGNALGNILIGGASSDMITAGSGRSVIIGGGGGDVITGGSGDAILISGTTTFDNNFAALASILAEWQRTDKTYSQRITDLRTGTGLNGANKLIWGSTVLDDNNADTLVGGAGLDWFFANQGPGGIIDTIRNFRSPEQIN